MLISQVPSSHQHGAGKPAPPNHLKGEILIKERKETPQDRYHKAHTKMLTIRLVETTEQDIIQRLDSVPSKAGYIKSLIRADIARGGEA